MIKLNGQVITPTIFPDKTSQVWKLDEKIIHPTHNKITWLFENEAEFIHIAQLIELLNIITSYRVNLFIPYFPYARQDKSINNNATFAGHTFRRLLGNLHVDITTLDIHNPELIFASNITSITVNDMLASFLNTKDLVVVFPDEGALKRYKDITNDYAYFKKERNQLTGEIINQELIFKNEIVNKDVILIDDLCDAGGTFIKAAKILLQKKAKSVSLYVTHGLFTKGVQVLKNSGIKQIFTIDYETQEIKEIL